MSREIKFRQTWRNDTTGMISYSYWTLDQLKQGIGGVDSHTLLSDDQYTGLKDKNGVEIYEGDIVKCYGESENEIVGDIYWHKGGFNVRTVDAFWSPAEKDWEVIGNIYENPELLNG